VARGALPELDDYFRRVGRDWSGRAASGRSFRSVAYVESEAKAFWLVQRALESREDPATSFAVVRQRSIGESATLCFHLVQKNDVYMSFLYPSPDMTGSMQGLCVYGPDTYSVLLSLFDRVWVRAAPLASGRVLHREGLVCLASLSPSLPDTADFRKAMAMAAASELA
jgi:hypothetical protein